MCISNEIYFHLKEYVNKSEIMTKAIMFGFDISSRHELIIAKGEYLQGKKDFNKTIITPFFHGRGCRIEDWTGKTIIDWDFGYNDSNIVGINPYLFCDFLNEYNTVKKYSCQDILDNIEILVENGVLYEKYDLYYFNNF